jgi:hypothetical protein
MEKEPDKHSIFPKSEIAGEIAGFNFEKLVMLIHPPNAIMCNGEPLYYVEPITADEAQDLRDFFYDQRARS